MNDGRPILVTGATGQQGGATARHLLAAGRRVRALVRDPSADQATALAKLGAELVRGDLTDRASLDAAMAGTAGAFSIQPATRPGEPIEAEVRMGTDVAEAAAAAGVDQLVYTSVAGVDLNAAGTGWQSKLEIEQRIAELGVPATVLRPVMFMENHLHPGYGIRSDRSVLRLPPEGVRIQVIAVDDIGAFAALMFADPGRHLGQVYELAGDELTKADFRTKLSAATGIVPDLDPPTEPDPAVRLDIAALSRTGSFAGWNADLPALRAIHPGLKTYDDWLAAGAAAEFRKLYGIAA
ncbi:NmrA/HSCARG family protein [Microlunatus sp. GCM10028923]|uniref:NmrA/HSCARG family protein n=1 Tax=Microlunatus sp. GCM10028923 TaxID=3273400 RepID=UPI00361C4EB1